MCRVITTLALALCLLGCAGPVALFTGDIPQCAGLTGGGWAGPNPEVRGVLVRDAANGTAIKVETASPGGYPYPVPTIGSTVPLMWPEGITARVSFLGEIEVLNPDGKVVAMTGARYAIVPPVAYGDIPRYQGESWPVCSVTAV